MDVRRLITLLLAMLMAGPLLAGQAWCACAAELAMSSGGCCCKGAHAAADTARATGQDTLHKDCCCDTVDAAAPVSVAFAAPSASAHAPMLGTFAPAAICADAERHTAGSLTGATPHPPRPPRTALHARALVGGVGLRP